MELPVRDARRRAVLRYLAQPYRFVVAALPRKHPPDGRSALALVKSVGLRSVLRRINRLRASTRLVGTKRSCCARPTTTGIRPIGRAITITGRAYPTATIWRSLKCNAGSLGTKCRISNRVTLRCGVITWPVKIARP